MMSTMFKVLFLASVAKVAALPPPFPRVPLGSGQNLTSTVPAETPAEDLTTPSPASPLVKAGPSLSSPSIPIWVPPSRDKIPASSPDAENPTTPNPHHKEWDSSKEQLPHAVEHRPYPSRPSLTKVESSPEPVAHSPSINHVDASELDMEDVRKAYEELGEALGFEQPKRTMQYGKRSAILIQPKGDLDHWAGEKLKELVYDGNDEDAAEDAKEKTEVEDGKTEETKTEETKTEEVKDEETKNDESKDEGTQDDDAKDDETTEDAASKAVTSRETLWAKMTEAAQDAQLKELADSYPSTTVEFFIPSVTGTNSQLMNSWMKTASDQAEAKIQAEEKAKTLQARSVVSELEEKMQKVERRIRKVVRFDREKTDKTEKVVKKQKINTKKVDKKQKINKVNKNNDGTPLTDDEWADVQKAVHDEHVKLPKTTQPSTWTYLRQLLLKKDQEIRAKVGPWLHSLGKGLIEQLAGNRPISNEPGLKDASSETEKM